MSAWAPAGMGKRGHLPSPGKCTGVDLLHLQHFGSHKKYQNRYYKRHVSPAQSNPNCDCGRGSAADRTAWGSLAYPRPLAVLKKFASQQRKKAKWIGKEGRRGVEWRDRGRDGEEREEVDFTPSCKNSCGRPWRRPLAGRRTATDLGYDRTLYIRSVHAIGIIQASIMGRELWMLRCWSTGSTMGPHFVRSARNHLCTSCEI